MFVTVFYGIYHIDSGMLEYCNGGHNSPYILYADGNIEMLPISPNPMVGVVEGIPYKGEQTMLGVGDTLVMYTDGVNEANNAAFEEYGDDRMEQTLKKLNGKTCKEIIDGQLESVKEFTADTEQSDDITIMALKRMA
jgi:sigma-B regulation protein RsbU (phosphoserine phosphatase)